MRPARTVSHGSGGSASCQLFNSSWGHSHVDFVGLSHVEHRAREFPARATGRFSHFRASAEFEVACAVRSRFSLDGPEGMMLAIASHTLLRVFPHRPGLYRLRRERGDHLPAPGPRPPAPVAGERHVGGHGDARSEVPDLYRLTGVLPPRRGPPPVVATDEKVLVSCFIIAMTMRTTEFPGEPSPSVPSFTTYARIYAADNNALPVFPAPGAPSEIPIPRTTSRTRPRWQRFCSALWSGFCSPFVSSTAGLRAGGGDTWSLVKAGEPRHYPEVPFQRSCFRDGEPGPVEALGRFRLCVEYPC